MTVITKIALFNCSVNQNWAQYILHTKKIKQLQMLCASILSPNHDDLNSRHFISKIHHFSCVSNAWATNIPFQLLNIFVRFHESSQKMKFLVPVPTLRSNSTTQVPLSDFWNASITLILQKVTYLTSMCQIKVVFHCYKLTTKEQLRQDNKSTQVTDIAWVLGT